MPRPTYAESTPEEQAAMLKADAQLRAIVDALNESIGPILSMAPGAAGVLCLFECLMTVAVLDPQAREAIATRCRSMADLVDGMPWKGRAPSDEEAKAYLAEDNLRHGRTPGPLDVAPPGTPLN